APPLLASRDPTTGEPRKRIYGAWIFHAFRLLAGMKRLRGTAFDIFGLSAERRTERRLVVDYEKTIDRLLAGLDAQNHALALEIAGLAEQIRGFGHVKARSLARVKVRETALLAAFGRADAATAAE